MENLENSLNQTKTTEGAEVVNPAIGAELAGETEVPFSEQLFEIDSEMSQTESQREALLTGAENDEQRINEIREQMGLSSETEEAPSVLAQKEEAKKLQELEDSLKKRSEEIMNERVKQKRIEELAAIIFERKMAEEFGNDRSESSEEVRARLKDEAYEEAKQIVESDIYE